MRRKASGSAHRNLTLAAFGLSFLIFHAESFSLVDRPNPFRCSETLSSSSIASGVAPLRLQMQPTEKDLTTHRTGFWYQAGRKLTIGTIAGLNSEVLFTNQKPGEGLANALLLYAPTMIVMDELVQCYNLDGMSTFFLGSIYGLFIEGIIAATIQEEPAFFLAYVTTFWHGMYTTYTSFEIGEAYFPRRAPGHFSKGWMIAGTSTTALASALFLGSFSGETIQENWPAYAGAAALGCAYGGLIAWRVSARKPYTSRPWFTLGLIPAGFGLGLWHQSLLDAGEKHYTTEDHIARTGIYATIEIGTLMRVWHRKAPDQARRMGENAQHTRPN